MLKLLVTSGLTALLLAGCGPIPDDKGDTDKDTDTDPDDTDPDDTDTDDTDTGRDTGKDTGKDTAGDTDTDDPDDTDTGRDTGKDTGRDTGKDTGTTDTGDTDTDIVDCVTAADTDGVTRVVWFHAAFDNATGADIGTVNETSFLDMIADIEAGTGWQIDIWYYGTADVSGTYPEPLTTNAAPGPLTDYDALFVESDEMAIMSWPYDRLSFVAGEEPWSPVVDAVTDIQAVRGTRTVVTGIDVDFHAGEWRSFSTGAVDTLSHKDGARVTDGSDGLLVNMLQWVIDGDGLGIVAPTVLGWYDAATPLGMAGNPGSFLYTELNAYWSDAYNAYDDVEILDATHLVNAGLTDADLAAWPSHGVIDYAIPGYTGIQQTTGDSGSNVGYTTVVKDFCEL
ncbi:MAG: hypothetical protein Q7U06_01665 [Pseudomonadota bacterium]|nr:hypothetical protein [Pseudomonadota bacterium]